MKKLISFLLIISLVGCTKVYNEAPTSPSPVAPTTKTADKIEFRVFGQNVFSPVSIRHTDPINGVTIYSGGIPYFAAVSSKDDSIFLFIDASGNGNFSSSSLQVQIFVNGKLFREAFSQGFALQAQASGTYRRE